MKVLWSPLADEQVDEIVAYIAVDDRAAALAWLEQLLERVASLVRFPDSGRTVPELQRDDMRELLVGSYRVIYRRKADVVEIATIRHGAHGEPLLAQRLETYRSPEPTGPYFMYASPVLGGVVESEVSEIASLPRSRAVALSI